MRRVKWLIVMACLLPLPAVLGQGEGKKGTEPPTDEAQLGRAIDEILRPRRTERDVVLRSLAKFTDGERLERPDAGDAEFATWYDRLAAGQRIWRKDDITHRSLHPIHDRITQRLRLTGGEVRRDEFLRYARQYLSAKDSPPWDDRPPRDPLEEGRKLFRRLDTDRNGSLSASEMPEGLRVELRRWDDDGNGRISEKEYLRRFDTLLHQAARKRGVVVPGEEPSPTDARPTVYRANRLPPGLPDWFSGLDTDHDGQVGLYEWKRAGGALAEFRRYDANADGFITVEECLRIVATARASEAGK